MSSPPPRPAPPASPPGASDPPLTAGRIAFQLLPVFIPLVALLILFLATGCARSEGSYAKQDYAYNEQMQVQEEYGGEREFADGYANESAAMSAPMAPPPSSSMKKRDSAAQIQISPEPAPTKGGAQQAQDQAPKRMIYYNGFLRLQVQSMETAMAQAGGVAVTVEGFVERLGNGSITLRVPVARFDEALDALESIGEVLARQIDAQDVSDAFEDASLRLRSYTATRDRLVELLARATSEEEKLRLLKEIQRLSQLIESLTLQTQTLQELASFSRITLEFIPRAGPGARHSAQTIAAFDWMAPLGPFRGRPPSGDRLELKTPDGLVALEPSTRRGPYVAEGPDGAVLWATRLDNAPLGSEAFWAKALLEAHSEGFGEVATEPLGAFTLLRFEEVGETPYTWILAVDVSPQYIDLIHIYLPTPEAKARHWPALKAMLSERGGDAS